MENKEFKEFGKVIPVTERCRSYTDLLLNEELSMEVELSEEQVLELKNKIESTIEDRILSSDAEFNKFINFLHYTLGVRANIK